MIKSIKIFSIILIISCFIIYFKTYIDETKDKVIQNKIIDNVFNVQINNNEETKEDTFDDYLGYIYIPRFNIKRLIKNGTTPDILDDGYVGMHYKSGKLDSDNLIILAGHNIKNVFNLLHSINIGDSIYINSYELNRKFIVYKTLIVDEYNNNYLYNRTNELLLITCDKKGYRLLVFLREEL